MRFYVYLCIREMPTQQHCSFILKRIPRLKMN